ncbi:MAG: hypothetical protein MZV63_66490 [Marinilabiliales bacterium]|nr:hypothetical protein [Marinilabiliales bacterium]
MISLLLYFTPEATRPPLLVREGHTRSGKVGSGHGRRAERTRESVDKKIARYT